MATVNDVRGRFFGRSPISLFGGWLFVTMITMSVVVFSALNNYPSEVIISTLFTFGVLLLDLGLHLYLARFNRTVIRRLESAETVQEFKTVLFGSWPMRIFTLCLAVGGGIAILFWGTA